MLKLQKFIKDNPLDWEEKLKNDPYNIAIKHDLGCVIFNYNLFSSDFSNPIVKECRGVILYEEDFEVAALSFYKFFNYGQEFADDIDWSSARVLPSLIIVLLELSSQPIASSPVSLL